jgi:EAL domain-containing protein (putative c-di-GMP-specific phosphodiesterase class I)/ActR/RegA family two-component response regulator
MRQTILLVDDDCDITDALSMLLERPGRTLVVCADVESAELALARFPVTDLVTDVQFSGLFGFEGLHFIDRVRATAPTCRVVLMTGYATEDLRRAAADYGATAVLGKPFDVGELEHVLACRADTPVCSLPEPSPSPHEPFELIRVPSIDEILTSGVVGTAFQPIVSMNGDNGEPFAFEALARIRGGWAVGGPAELFEYAARRSRSVQLNRVAMIAAIEAAAELPPSALIFINIDPPAFSDRHLATDVIAAAGRAGVPLGRLVLEITERTSLLGDAVSTDAFATLRANGVRFALDDHGSAYSHLPTISTIKPSFIKISQVFGTAFETDENKQRVVRHVVALAHDFGCAAVLEGIESGDTARAAADLGIDLAQGYFYSLPHDVSHWRGVAA